MERELSAKKMEEQDLERKKWYRRNRKEGPMGSGIVSKGNSAGRKKRSRVCIEGNHYARGFTSREEYGEEMVMGTKINSRRCC